MLPANLGTGQMPRVRGGSFTVVTRHARFPGWEPVPGGNLIHDMNCCWAPFLYLCLLVSQSRTAGKRASLSCKSHPSPDP